MYRSIAAFILQIGLGLSDLLALTYNDIKEELEKGITPLCLDISRKKTGVQFMMFLGTWAVKLLKGHFLGLRLEDTSPIHNVSARTLHAYFRKTAGNMPVSLRTINAKSLTNFIA